MYKYYVYTTIVIKGKIYQHLTIYGSFHKIPEDLIKLDISNRYRDELLKCDEYHINIVLKFK